MRDFKLETNRLFIVPITQDYADEIFTTFTAEITVYMLPKPADRIEEIQSFITESQKTNAEGTNLQLVILNKETGEFLGCVGLHQLNKRDPEFGIWLKKDAHGNGFGLEAGKALIHWGLINLDPDYIKYPVDRANIASRRIPEACGGEIKDEYTETGLGGNIMNTVEYHIYPEKR